MLPFFRLSNPRFQIRVILGLALIARLVYFAVSNRYDSFLIDGDSPWYIQNGWFILHSALPAPLSTIGPLYPLLLAAAWLVFPGVPNPTDVALVPYPYLALIRLAQIALSLLMVRLAYQCTYRLTGDHRASMITAVGLGLGPAFIAEPFHILTETVFMALLMLAIWFYTVALDRRVVKTFAFSGLIFGLAALTRPILLLFPFCLVPHIWFSAGSHVRTKGLGAFLGVFLATLLPWGLYLYQSTGTVLPEGLLSNLWIGSFASGKFQGSQTLDSLRFEFEGGETDYATEALRNISSDPVGWIALRARNTIEAMLQPHGTDNLPDFHIKRDFVEWLQSDRSLVGLWILINIPGFWDKLAIYIFHYAALIFGVVGSIIARQRWRRLYVPYLAIIYFIGLYGVLTIQPRYVFPTQLFFWLFAGFGLVETYRRFISGKSLITANTPTHA